tara:strand:- start:496 stop:723 length:228 start_codon:yes stop_codon:yes gene_type:complete
MRIKPIASNQTELHMEDGTVVLFSYETPVAAYLPECGYVKTSKHWSKTTSRHINKWCDCYQDTISQDVLYSVTAH